MLEIGLSTATFFGKVPVEDSFALIRGMGVTVAEVFLTTYSEYRPAFGELLAERARGIRAHSIHTLNSQFEPQLFHGVERTRRDAEAIFCMALENGRKLGAKYYTFHGPARLKRREYVYDYPSLGKKMQRVLELAQGYGIAVSYENVHWAYYSAPGYFTALKRYCPGLCGTLDIKQAFQGGTDYRDFIADMGRSISTVHVCDYDENGALKPVGRGCFDFAELFRVLRGEGIDAPVLVELYSGDYADFSEVAESVAYLRSL